MNVYKGNYIQYILETTRKSHSKWNWNHEQHEKEQVQRVTVVVKVKGKYNYISQNNTKNKTKKIIKSINFKSMHAPKKNHKEFLEHKSEKRLEQLIW